MTNVHISLLSIVLAIVTCYTTCGADLIAEHLGSVDPTTEGWTAIPGDGGVDVGPIDDGGTPAWFVDDNSTESGSTFLYEQIISPDDIAIGNSVGWTLSTTLRVASDEELTFDGSPFLTYVDGTIAWRMYFGLNASGDTFVRLYTSVNTGPVHTIAGNSSYNIFSLVYDPVSASADLFVNGEEVISDYVGEANSQTRVSWGAGRSPDRGQGNFNRVSFETFSETATPVKN